MAFDGVVIASLVSEFNKCLVGGRIYKIYQPEVDEICLVIKNRTKDCNVTKRLVISVDASLPLMYLAKDGKDNPMVAPNFCMLLRKHIGNGRILEIRQPNFERIAEFTIEHLDELGDLCKKKLIVELMGKHSNIIFTDAGGKIIDSIKHVSFQISSVREVLPGREYVYPPMQDKKNPMEIEENDWMNHVMEAPVTVAKAIYMSITGISPVMANEIAFRAGIDGSASTASVSAEDKKHLFQSFVQLRQHIIDDKFCPCIAYEGYEPKEFSSLLLHEYGDVHEEEDFPANNKSGLKQFSSISEVIADYYHAKSVVTRMKQRGADLRKIVASAIERTAKKYDLQCAQLKDTKDREKYRIYGELITAFGYNCKPGDKELLCENYYDQTMVTIPLDETISAMDNAKRYFEKYNKQKRTYQALSTLSLQSKEELDYLLSVLTSLSFAGHEQDLLQIKEELIESGYVRGKINNKKAKSKEKSKPLHYRSSDGFDMYVGKNNYQNEAITFALANGNDMWFHAKQMPGSHVIVKVDASNMIPDSTYEEAARLAAYYSSGKQAPKVEIDYTMRKNLKKPPKAKPGYVIYHTNYSMTIEPDIHGIEEVK